MTSSQAEEETRLGISVDLRPVDGGVIRHANIRALNKTIYPCHLQCQHSDSHADVDISIPNVRSAVFRWFDRR